MQDKIYLPPPFKFVTKRELQKMLNDKEIVPCNGIHLDSQLRVDYFVIKVHPNKLNALVMGGEGRLFL